MIWFDPRGLPVFYFVSQFMIQTFPHDSYKYHIGPILESLPTISYLRCPCYRGPWFFGVIDGGLFGQESEGETLSFQEDSPVDEPNIYSFVSLSIELEYTSLCHRYSCWSLCCPMLQEPRNLPSYYSVLESWWEPCRRTAGERKTRQSCCSPLERLNARKKRKIGSG